MSLSTLLPHWQGSISPLPGFPCPPIDLRTLLAGLWSIQFSPGWGFFRQLNGEGYPHLSMKHRGYETPSGWCGIDPAGAPGQPRVDNDVTALTLFSFSTTYFESRGLFTHP
jgi:hypothetical protein